LLFIKYRKTYNIFTDKVRIIDWDKQDTCGEWVRMGDDENKNLGDLEDYN